MQHLHSTCLFSAILTDGWISCPAYTEGRISLHLTCMLSGMWKKTNTNRRWTCNSTCGWELIFCSRQEASLMRSLAWNIKVNFAGKSGVFREAVRPCPSYTVWWGCTCWLRSTDLNLEFTSVHYCLLMTFGIDRNSRWKHRLHPHQHFVPFMWNLAVVMMQSVMSKIWEKTPRVVQQYIYHQPALQTQNYPGGDVTTLLIVKLEANFLQLYVNSSLFPRALSH